MALQSQWQRTHQILCRKQSCAGANSLLIHKYCSPWERHMEIWLPWEVVESPLLETFSLTGSWKRLSSKRFSDQVIHRIPFQHLFHRVFYFATELRCTFLRHPQICVNSLEANITEEAGLKLTRRETLNPHSCLLHSPAASYILIPCTPADVCITKLFLKKHLGKEKTCNKYACIGCLSNKNIFCPT